MRTSTPKYPNTIPSRSKTGAFRLFPVMAKTGEKILKAGALLGIPLLAGLTASVVSVLPGVSSLFQYDRDRLAEGEIWRLLTCHWTHWSADHLFWDAAVFVILLGWSLKTRFSQTALVLALASLSIPLGIYWIQPDLIYYRGLSGLDSALMVYVAMQLIRTMTSKDGWERLLVPGVLAGLGLKIAFEALSGQAVFVAEMAPNVTVVPLAHIIGAAIGVAFGLTPFPAGLLKSRSPSRFAEKNKAVRSFHFG